MLEARPGTYALLMRVGRRRELRVGRAGTSFSFRRGMHAYVGSALGPGGLRSRLERHARDAKRLHWHIDYLLAETERIGALYRVSARRLECTWAEWFAGRSTALVGGFGATDCRCEGHLVRLPSALSVRRLVRDAGEALGASFDDWRD